MENANSREYLEKILSQVLENMKRTAHAPSVQMTDVPRESLGMNDDDEAALDDMDEDENPDKRITQRKADKYIEKNGELSDSEDEDMTGLNGHMSNRKLRAAQNYRHILDVGGNDSGVETGSALGTPHQGSSVPDDADEMNVDEVEDKPAQTSTNDNLVQDANGSVAVSGPQSPNPAPAPAPASLDDGDVEMGEADEDGFAPTESPDATATNPVPVEEESTITVQQQQTPPESPSAPQQEESAPVTTAEASAQDHATVAQTEEQPDPAPIVAPTATTEPEATGATAEETAIKEEAVGDDEIAKAQEEGRMEREVANAEGEARTEAAAKAEE